MAHRADAAFHADYLEAALLGVRRRAMRIVCEVLALRSIVEKQPFTAAERSGQIVEYAQQHAHPFLVGLLDRGVADRPVAEIMYARAAGMPERDQQLIFHCRVGDPVLAPGTYRARSGLDDGRDLAL